MKNFILAMLLFAFAFICEGQKVYYPAADDTIKGDTNYIPSSSGYDLRNIESGVLSFTFTHTDVADSLSFAGLEWRNTTTQSWTAYSGNGALSATTTDGQSEIYISTPLRHKYVRARLSCASGDTVAITKQLFMLKED